MTVRSSQASFPVSRPAAWRPRLSPVRKDGYWTERIVAIPDSPLSGLSADYKPCHQAARVPAPDAEAWAEACASDERAARDAALFKKLRPIRAKENAKRAALRACRVAEQPKELPVADDWGAIMPSARPPLPNIVADPSLVIKPNDVYDKAMLEKYYEGDDSPTKAWAVPHRKDDAYYRGFLQSALSAMRRFRKANPDVALDIVKGLNDRVEAIRVTVGA